LHQFQEYTSLTHRIENTLHKKILFSNYLTESRLVPNQSEQVLLQSNFGSIYQNSDIHFPMRISITKLFRKKYFFLHLFQNRNAAKLFCSYVFILIISNETDAYRHHWGPICEHTALGQNIQTGNKRHTETGKTTAIWRTAVREIGLCNCVCGPDWRHPLKPLGTSQNSIILRSLKGALNWAPQDASITPFGQETEIFSKIYRIKPKSDCIHHFNPDLDPNGQHPFAVPNQSVHGKYNLISAWSNKIWKRFLSVRVN